MSWLPAAKKVKCNHQYTYVRIDGTECGKNDSGAILLDAVTANMLMTVYDALSEKNQNHYSSLPLMDAVAIGWKVIK